MSALSRDLHTSTTGLQWVVDGYSLALAALLLSGGALADRRGSKAVFCTGVGVFTLCSAIAGTASSAAMLIAARAAQGAGTALAVPASLSLLQAIYTDQRARRRAFGIWGGVAGIAAGAGPVLGGALVSAAGWRSVFFVNVPVGLAGLLLLAGRVVPSVGRRPHGVDPAGQAAACVALTGLTGSAPVALLALEEFLGDAHVGRLADVLGLTHSGAVRLVAQLEREGLAERHQGSDRRRVEVRLTTKGQRRAIQARAARDEVIVSAISGLNVAEGQSLEALLDKVISARVARRIERRRAGEGGAWWCRTRDFAACGRPQGRCPAQVTAMQAVTQ